MDLKQQAAKAAVSLIKNGLSVGLGAGATMAYMVDYLKEESLTLQLYTSSAATKTALLQHGFAVNDIAAVAALDIYFDGCDQFDKALNALKSGGGIHTMEKLLASMAKAFVLVGDESKYAEQLGTKFPIVLEVLPPAVSFVAVRLEHLFNGSSIVIRRNAATGEKVITEYGNHLMDVWFSPLPELSQLNPLLKSITGVVETSLFYNMAHKAIIAGKDGLRIIEKAL